MNFSHLNFGLFSLSFYGVVMSIAFVIAAWKYYKTLQKVALPVDFFVHHFWHWMLGGLLVGRIVSLIFSFDIFLASPLFSFFAFWEGGMNQYGFILGFLAFLWRETHDHQFGFWRWVEQSITPLFILLIFHDFSSLVSGQVYGFETNLPWGIHYETFGVETINPVHPIGAYGLILHVFLLYVWHYRWKIKKNNSMLYVYKILWALLLAEFFMQFFIDKQAGYVAFIFTYNQVILLGMLAPLSRIIWQQTKSFKNLFHSH